MTLRAISPSSTLSNVTITGGSLNGTNLTNASVTFTTYTPSLSALGGTLGTASATGRYTKIGNLVTVLIQVTLTSIGSATGAVIASLPTNALTAGVIPGRETALTGSMLQGFVQGTNSPSVLIFGVANGFPGGNGASLVLGGDYESA
jgi:hypothetical protein